MNHDLNKKKSTLTQELFTPEKIFVKMPIMMLHGKFEINSQNHRKKVWKTMRRQRDWVTSRELKKIAYNNYQGGQKP